MFTRRNNRRQTNNALSELYGNAVMCVGVGAILSATYFGSMIPVVIAAVGLYSLFGVFRGLV